MDGSGDHRLFRTRLLSGLIAGNVLVALVIALFLFQSRQFETQQARLQAGNLADILEQHVSGQIHRIDLTLQAVVDEIEFRQGVQSGRVAKTVTDVLADHEKRLQDFAFLRVTDPSGLVVHGQGVVPERRASIGDRPYFQKQRDDPGAGLSISPPVVGKVSGLWSLGLARRINNPDGSFAGVVYAQIPLANFARILTGIEVGPHGAVSLSDADLAIITRHPEPGGLGSLAGRRYDAPELLQFMAEGRRQGVY